MQKYFIVPILLICAITLSGCVGVKNDQKSIQESNLPNKPVQKESKDTKQKADIKPEEDFEEKAVIVDNSAFNKKVEFGYLCKPEGPGPFAGVVYNHGGTGGEQIGGDPEGACKALAKDGYVGYSPIREVGSAQQNLDEIYAGLDYIQTLPYVNKDRIAMLGFSRGAAMTYMIGDEPALDTIVLMATAPASVAEASKSKIKVPVLLLVAENDTPGQLNGGKDIHQGMQDLYSGLINAGVEATLKVYPPYPQHGHLMFFEIGAYWSDVIDFLKKNL